MGGSASISVVVPVHNGERYLAAAIESVLAQSVEVEEILVADDGSTDASVAVARRYPRVTVLPGPHAGISPTTNRGVDAARGDLLAFIDADDLWTPRKLEIQMARMSSAPDMALIFGMAVNFLSPDLDAKAKLRLEPPSEPVPGFAAGALLVRRSVFARVGRWRTDVLLGGFIDWCARADDIGCARIVVPDLVLRRRLHGGNVGLRQPEARRDLLRVVKDARDRRRPT